jgi:hypothetical protein
MRLNFFHMTLAFKELDVAIASDFGGLSAVSNSRVRYPDMRRKGGQHVRRNQLFSRSSPDTALCSQARRRVAYPEEAATQAFATAAEAAELILFPPGDWPLLKCGVGAAAAGLAYEAAAGELPPAEPWPAAFADEDEEAVAWATRYQEFQRTASFLGPFRAERAAQARLLRDMVGNPFRL